MTLDDNDSAVKHEDDDVEKRLHLSLSQHHQRKAAERHAEQQNHERGKRHYMDWLPVNPKTSTTHLSQRLVTSEASIHKNISLWQQSLGSNEHHNMPAEADARAKAGSEDSPSPILKIVDFGQMQNLVSHMGELDTPRSCANGRPIIRHTTTLRDIESLLWQESHINREVEAHWDSEEDDEEDDEETYNS